MKRSGQQHGESAKAGRLLLVVHSEYPVSESRGRRQAEAAASGGWQVDVLSLFVAASPPSEVVDGVSVRRTRVRRKRDMGMAGLFAEYGRFWLAVLWYCLTNPRYDVVLVANPPDFLVFAAVPQRLKGALVFLDIHDLMTDLFTVRMANPGRWKLALLRWLERRSMLFADGVMTVHEPYRQRILKRAGPGVSVNVVMNSADDSRFALRSSAPPDPPVVMYHGSLFERYGVVDLVAAFAEAIRSPTPARLWLVGEGDAVPMLRAEAANRDIEDRVVITPHMQPAEAIVQMLRAAHLGVVPNQPNPLNQYALSTKLFEYVATGVPVVCAGLPTLRQYFDEDELLFFAPGSRQDLKDALAWALDHREDMAARANRAHAHYVRSYAWPEQRRIFLAVLDSKGGRRRRAFSAHSEV